MKPAAFDYVAVRTPQEAVFALAEEPGEARILAGGQSLVLDMNYRRERPARLVDINGVAELDRVERQMSLRRRVVGVRLPNGHDGSLVFEEGAF